MTSASARARPKSRASTAVREYRCGWKTATRRRGDSVRAARSVAAPGGKRAPTVRVLRGGRELQELGDVGEHDRAARSREERAKGLAQLRERGKRGVVIELDVHQHRNLDVQAQHREIGLVRLHHQ